jgi:hypothetical protein
MDRSEDPFVAIAPSTLAEDLACPDPRPSTAPVVTVARLCGFDLADRPLVAGVPAHPGEVLAARSTVPLRRSMIGQDVVVLFQDDDPRAPVVVGVLLAAPLDEAPSAPGVSVHADGERHVIQAEREIVLRCGEASITLTRAGKVIIRGHYILSRSTGCNKLKGASIDIN